MGDARVSALANFEIAGEAAPGRVKAAGLLDLLAAAVIAMILVPQPVVRQALMSAYAGPIGIALFVLALIAAILLVFGVYLAFSAVTWGRTPAMYLLDLGLDAPTKPTTREALGWAAGWMLAAVPALVGVGAFSHPVSGLPARVSGVPTRAVVPRGTGADSQDGR